MTCHPHHRLLAPRLLVSVPPGLHGESLQQLLHLVSESHRSGLGELETVGLGHMIHICAAQGLQHKDMAQVRASVWKEHHKLNQRKYIFKKIYSIYIV